MPADSYLRNNSMTLCGSELTKLLYFGKLTVVTTVYSITVLYSPYDMYENSQNHTPAGVR